MAKTKISTFDAAEYLDTPELVAAFLNEAFETNDPVYITKAVGIAARAKGMTNVSRESGLSRESLYRSLTGDSNPEFGTIVHLLASMCIQPPARAQTA